MASDEAASALLLPLRSLATRVPALQVMELPFLFHDLDTVHAALDGELGGLLRRQARQRGWEILAFWDEGMHALSGNRRYDRAINLTGMEFILLRPDPVAEKQFTALDAWTRAARPQSREQLLRECMIGSRSASLQQIWRERLDRVHLDLTLSGHRYEGWVVVAAEPFWQGLSQQDRKKLQVLSAAATVWQRGDARQRNTAALARLRASGMSVYRLSQAQRDAFVKRLPSWKRLLSDRLDNALKTDLVTAATAGFVSRRDESQALPDPEPGTPGG